MNFYQSMFMIFLLGFGIRFLYFRLNKGWIVTLGMAVITGIAWISSVDKYSQYNNEGKFVLAILSTALFAGIVFGEIVVQLSRHLKKKKSTPENTFKGEPT